MERQGSNSQNSLRRRRLPNDDTTKTRAPPPHDATSTTTTRPSSSSLSSFLSTTTITTTLLLHLFFVSFYVFGILHRIRTLHTGVECDMTYSMRHFVPIIHTTPHTHDSYNKNYKLYQFTDRRDARFHEQNTNNNNNNKSSVHIDNCNPSHLVVLYVPGHWGSYSQSRSLGAHGIQLTRQHESKRHVEQVLAHLKQRNSIKHNTTTIYDDDYYDVYAIDFLEQGAGLHGRFLHAQAQFVAHVVEFLMLRDNCHSASHIAVVGHSIGGVVARAARVLYMDTGSSTTTRSSDGGGMRTLITLASPHAKLSYAWDESVEEFYKTLEEHSAASSSSSSLEDDFAVISISGGLRDELIAPELCRVEGKNTMTLLANDIMAPRQDSGMARARFGMDHRAIVWCHNLLLQVRKMILGLERTTTTSTTTGDTSTSERLRRVQEQFSGRNDDMIFAERLEMEREEFRREFGFWTSLAMESSMLYRLELLIGMYVVGCCLYMLAPNLETRAAWYSVAIPCVLSVVGWTLSNADMTAGCFVVLAFVANAVIWACRVALRVTSQQLSTETSTTRVLVMQAVWIMIIATFVQVVAMLLEYQQDGIFRLSAQWIFVIIFLAVPAIGWTSCRPKRPDREISFAAVVVPTWPCLVFGKLDVALWGAEMQWEGTSKDLLKVCALLGGPLFLRLAMSPSEKERPVLGIEGDYQSKLSRAVRPISDALHVLALLVLGPLMLQVGGGHVAGKLIMYMAWIGYLESIVQAALARRDT